MGLVTREGIGCGMSEREAQRDFTRSLNEEYGSGSYRGGGNDIRSWKSVKCIKKPVPAVQAKRAKTTKIEAKRPGKLVNGFKVTNRTSTNFHFSFMNPEFKEQTEFSLKLADAKTSAAKLAMKHGCQFEVVPARLWEDVATKKLSLPPASYSVEPVGEKLAEPGEWHFVVLCSC